MARDTARTTIHTYTGEVIDLLDVQPHNIHIEDITKSLGCTRRFNGHTLESASTPWTVLHHSLYVSDMLFARGCTRQTVVAALLHDAHEAYIGDIATPVKNIIAETDAYHQLVESIDAAVAARFGFDPALFHCDAVRDADATALRVEAYNLLETSGVPQINEPGWFPSVQAPMSEDLFWDIKRIPVDDAKGIFRYCAGVLLP